jgi:hypothetical protein
MLRYSRFLFPQRHVTRVPCHHGIACAQTADGSGLRMYRVAPNILNKQSRTADKEWFPSLGFGKGLNISQRKRPVGLCYKVLHRSSDLDGFFELRIRTGGGLL